MSGKCSVPDCDNNLSKVNVTRVCKEHMHHKDYCRCYQCIRIQLGQEKTRLRIRTRAELVQMGLLPEQRIF